MEINFNVTGSERSRLAGSVGRFIGEKAKYMRAPNYEFQIGKYTVTRDGILSFDDSVETDEAERLTEFLKNEGFEPEPTQAATFADSESQATTPTHEPIANVGQFEGLSVAVPLNKVNCMMLTNLLEAKSDLIKKALGVDNLKLETGTDRVSFPWFSEVPSADECLAYTQFISALCKMSKDLKRVNATAKEVENEKYAFRCFLLRLGFIGNEYKQSRKILLRNFTGSSAFKSGERKPKDENTEQGTDSDAEKQVS